MPHGAGVLALSRKSRSYCLAGGNVSATWARATCQNVVVVSISSNDVRHDASGAEFPFVLRNILPRYRSRRENSFCLHGKKGEGEERQRCSSRRHDDASAFTGDISSRAPEMNPFVRARHESPVVRCSLRRGRSESRAMNFVILRSILDLSIAALNQISVTILSSSDLNRNT